MSTGIGTGRAAPERKSSHGSFTREKRLESALISLSIANLSFLFVWGRLIEFARNEDMRFFQHQAPDGGLIWAVVVDIAVLAAVLFACLLSMNAHRRAVRWASCGVLGFFALFALYQLQRSIRPSLALWLSTRSIVVLKIVLAVVVLYLFGRSFNRGVRALKSLFVILSPLFLILTAQAWWLYRTVDLRTVRDGAVAGMLPVQAHAVRVVWVIFDELDDRFVFKARPDRIKLPEFDRLRTESIYADHVTPPNPNTLPSMQSLLLGKTITDWKFKASGMPIRIKGVSGWKDFNSEPNIFSRARDAGYDAGLAGWGQYCRLIGKDLSECKSTGSGPDSLGAQAYLRRKSFAKKAVYLAEWQSRAVPFIVEPPNYIAPDMVPIYRENTAYEAQYLMANGIRMLQDQKLNLVFIHLPPPHPPGFWSAANQTFTTRNSNYIDNLQLADRMLGQLRQALEPNGHWDRSAILVSGDHPYRADHWHLEPEMETAEMKTTEEIVGRTWPAYIPFLLKLPGQRSEVNYKGHFDSVISSDLVMELLQQHLRTPDEAVKWLDQHAAESMNR